MDERKSQAELAKLLSDTESQVTIGARYMHYNGLYYTVRHIALLEATNEPAVVYQAEYGAHITFIRPLSDWLATIEQDGKKLVRFVRVASAL